MNVILFLYEHYNIEVPFLVLVCKGARGGRTYSCTAVLHSKTALQDAHLQNIQYIIQHIIQFKHIIWFWKADMRPDMQHIIADVV